MKTEKELKKLHEGSFKNKSRLLGASSLGCFQCLYIFSLKDVKEWCDRGETCLCPHCGVDSVLDITAELESEDMLKEMQDRWFNNDFTEL